VVDPREERLELRRTPLEDVDEEELAAALRGMRALHLDERRDRVRDVGEEDVVTGRSEPEDPGRHEQRGDEHSGRPRDAAARQNRKRCRPPSTTTVCPVT
jgi:hypothetical protein